MGPTATGPRNVAQHDVLTSLLVDNFPFLLWCIYLEVARAVFGIKNLNLWENMANARLTLEFV